MYFKLQQSTVHHPFGSPGLEQSLKLLPLLLQVLQRSVPWRKKSGKIWQNSGKEVHSDMGGIMIIM